MITFDTFLSSWAHPREDLEAKRKTSGFQTPLWEGLGGILDPIRHHLGTLLDTKAGKRLFWDTFWEVLGEGSKKTSKVVEVLTLSNPLD